MFDKRKDQGPGEPLGARPAEETQTDSQPLPWIRVDKNVVVFGVLLVAFSLVVWWVWSHLGNPTYEPSPTIVTETVEPAVAPPVVEPETTTSEPLEPEAERLEMRISVLDDTWVILHVDGELATNEVLRAGDVRNYAADNDFRFEVVGNAGGLDLTLNGTTIP